MASQITSILHVFIPRTSGANFMYSVLAGLIISLVPSCLLQLWRHVCHVNWCHSSYLMPNANPRLWKAMPCFTYTAKPCSMRWETERTVTTCSALQGGLGPMELTAAAAAKGSLGMEWFPTTTYGEHIALQTLLKAIRKTEKPRSRQKLTLSSQHSSGSNGWLIMPQNWGLLPHDTLC